MTRFPLTVKFIHDIQTDLQSSLTERPLYPQLFAGLIQQVGELSGALVMNTKESNLVGFNEIYLEAVRVAVMALRLATEGDAAFPYNPAEVTANLEGV